MFYRVEAVSGYREAWALCGLGSPAILMACQLVSLAHVCKEFRPLDIEARPQLGTISPRRIWGCFIMSDHLMLHD